MSERTDGTNDDVWVPARVIAIAVRTTERWRTRGDRGRLADLRRLSLNTLPGEAFWAIADVARADRFTEGFLREFLPLVASVRHRTGQRIGRSLRASGIAPARFERWLRLPREAAIIDARRLVRRCDSLDLVSLGVTLFYWTDETRMELAREFYRNPRAVISPVTVTTSATESIHG